MTFVVETIWWLVPFLMANQCPGFARALDLPFSKTPVAVRLLGENKTIGAYYVAVAGAIATLWVQSVFGLPAEFIGTNILLLGVCMGLGVALGDHVKSFVKRRLGIAPGAGWWPFDQLDFLIGGIIFSASLVGVPSLARFVMAVGLVLVIHPVGNYLGYRLGLRHVP